MWKFYLEIFKYIATESRIKTELITDGNSVPTTTLGEYKVLLCMIICYTRKFRSHDYYYF